MAHRVIEPHTNADLPSDVKITRRGEEVTLKFRLATVVTTPSGALAIARALMEVCPERSNPDPPTL